MNEDHTFAKPSLPLEGTGVAMHATGLADFDANHYLSELDEFDATEAQKLELLATLWSIMRSFVQLGYDVKICEQIFEATGLLSSDSPDALPLEDRINEEFAAAGSGKEGRE